MKDINLVYFRTKGKIYVPFDEHEEILENYKKEIERLKKVYVYRPKVEFKKSIKIKRRNERLNNIIDDLIEYIENNNWVLAETLEPVVRRDKILEILNKE